MHLKQRIETLSNTATQHLLYLFAAHLKQRIET